MLATRMRIRRVQEVDVDNLGEKIKAARMASSKSLTQICEEIGLSRSYWYDIEQEKIRGTLSLENLRKIEEVLGVDFNVKFD